MDIRRAHEPWRKQSADLGNLTLSYAPPEGSKLLRERIAALHGADAEHVLVMTGASEAIVALTCLFAGTGGSIVLPRPAYPAVPVMARAWGLTVREYDLDRERGFAQTADAVLAAVDATTRAVFVNSPHNPAGSVMVATEQRKLAHALATRGIPLIVDEVYRPLFFGPLDLPDASASASVLPNTIVWATSPRRCRSRGCASAGSSIATRSAGRHCSTCAATSRFPSSPLTEAIGAHALANAPAILARLAPSRAAISRCSRASWTSTVTCSAGCRRRGHHLFSVAS